MRSESSKNFHSPKRLRAQTAVSRTRFLIVAFMTFVFGPFLQNLTADAQIS